MGFIRAAIDSAKGVWRDSKFKEYVSVPQYIQEDVIAVKGEVIVEDPDGNRRQSNTKTTGLLSDGSIVIIPQGYVALAVSNGQFLVDGAIEPGVYIWDTKKNSTAFFNEEGIFKGVGTLFGQIKERFQFGGQVTAQQEVVFIKTQPITGVPFGTTAPVEFMSPIYRNLAIRFHGECDIYVHDPIMFFVNIVSRKFNATNQYSFKEVGDKIRKQLPPSIAVSLSKYAYETKLEIHGMNMMMDEVSKSTAINITNDWTKLYGLGISRLTIMDISYDEKSAAKVEKYDEQFMARDHFMDLERMRAQNEAMVAMAKNEAKGANMNSMMGVAMMPQMMGMVQGAFQNTNQTPNPAANNPQNPSPSPTPQSGMANASLVQPLFMQLDENQDKADPLGLLEE